MKDQLDSIAMDGSEKFRVQGAGVVREGLALGLPMDAFALYVASWTHFVKREVESGAEVKDMGAQGVTAPFRPGGSGLPAFLDMVDIFGDLAYDKTWRANVTRMYDTIAEHGMEFALDVVLGTVSAFPDSRALHPKLFRSVHGDAVELVLHGEVGTFLGAQYLSRVVNLQNRVLTSHAHRFYPPANQNASKY